MGPTENKPKPMLRAAWTQGCDVTQHKPAQLLTCDNPFWRVQRQLCGNKSTRKVNKACKPEHFSWRKHPWRKARGHHGRTFLAVLYWAGSTSQYLTADSWTSSCKTFFWVELFGILWEPFKTEKEEKLLVAHSTGRSAGDGLCSCNLPAPPQTWEHLNTKPKTTQEVGEAEARGIGSSVPWILPDSPSVAWKAWVKKAAATKQVQQVWVHQPWLSVGNW